MKVYPYLTTIASAADSPNRIIIESLKHAVAAAAAAAAAAVILYCHDGPWPKRHNEL